MRLIFILSLVFNTMNIFGQIVITDNNSNPIPFVQLNSNNKYFFAQTNLKGEVLLADITKLKDADTLFLHHVSYEKAFRIKRDLLSRDTIRLQQRSYELRELAVTSKGVKNKYQKISACYRSFQANNDSAAYYTDGKVGYLSKANKDNYKLLRKEYRSFANTRLEDEVIHRKVGITFKPGVPWPPFDYLPLNYAKKHHLKYIPIDNGRKGIFTRDSILIGEIEKSPKYIKYSINNIYSIGTRKAFETEVNLIKYEIVMLFRNNGDADETQIKRFDDLLYFKILREFKVKHDKDKDYTKILNIDELFIEDVWYTQSLSNEEYNSGFGMPKTSSYKSEFWKNCSCEAYYPPNKQITQGLHER